MTIQLYRQTMSEAFLLAQRSLQKLGFNTFLADERKGMLSTQKQSRTSGQIIFFDIRITGNKNTIKMLLVSNIFSETTCSFVADTISEELFLETLHDLLRIQPPDNPFRLSTNDYVLSSAL